MTRRIIPVLLLLLPIVAGCAGPSKLTRQSEERLARGEAWRAWTLATKALDKAPGNTQARAAATAAARAIADDWQRKIRGIAETDSVAAAEEALLFVSFRAGAVRYTTVPVGAGWAREEQALRYCAARTHYDEGVAALGTGRPKRACLHFDDVRRFVRDYRDVAALADRAYERAATTLSFVPLRVMSGPAAMGRDVSASWRGDVVERMGAPGGYFTKIQPVEDVERLLSLPDLGRVSRDEAIRVGRRAGADRVVWGTIGETESKTSIHFFTDVIGRRITDRDAEGHERVRWVDVPFECVARVRHVTVDLEYEVIATRTGTTLSRRRDPCTLSARAVWTAFAPEGALEAYALVSEPSRSADPDRAKSIETRWKAVVGEGTTLGQVLEAKRSSRGWQDRHEVIGRYIAGAAFVLLQELPSAQDLAFAALARGWKPVYEDVVRLDAIDDADLGLTVEATKR